MLRGCAVAFACLAMAALPVGAQAIDPARSTVTVRVAKAGLFAAFGHNHVVRAPIQQGEVNVARHSVVLAFASARLQVEDPGVSPKERSEVQQTMLGPQVLDTARYPEIRFASTQAEPERNGWRVQGQLSLHGVTRPLAVEVTSAGAGAYRGRARLRQTDFGIQPVRIAGGTVKVKDEVTVEFNIVIVK